MHLRKLFQIGLGLALFFVISGYAYYQTRNFAAGPTITINQPDTSVLSEQYISISGTAERVAFLSLNGRQIFTNEENMFEEQLVLSPGYNIMTVSARDTFGRSTEVEIPLLLQPPETGSSIIQNG